jgi:starvation-inducible DNA-binding protein
MKAIAKPQSWKGETAEALNPLLADLVVLSLHAKQAHWNVTGPQFQPLHELFDAVADGARGWYDDVAERLRALGEPADGRLAALVGTSLEEMPAGSLSGERAVALLLERVEGVAAVGRETLAPLGTSDPVTQDLVIGIVEGLEKQAWMLRAQAR